MSSRTRLPPSLPPSADGHRRRPAVRLRLQAKERRGRILSFILATDIRIFSISGFVNFGYEPSKFFPHVFLEICMVASNFAGAFRALILLDRHLSAVAAVLRSSSASGVSASIRPHCWLDSLDSHRVLRSILRLFPFAFPSLVCPHLSFPLAASYPPSLTPL